MTTETKELNKMQIKNRWNNKVIYEAKAESMRLLVLSAIGNDADLSGADLRGANLCAKLIAGEVDGSTYEGSCACLVGTIANTQGCKYNTIPGLSPNSSRPIERFFMGISKGHTPENNPPSKIVLEWLDAWVARMQATFGQRAVAP